MSNELPTTCHFFAKFESYMCNILCAMDFDRDSRDPSKIRVRNFTAASLVPEVPPKYRHLLPTVVLDDEVEFEVWGVSDAVANGLIRVIGGELQCKYLSVEPQDVERTDEFIIPSYLANRIGMIPILQSIPDGQVFTLEAANTEASVRRVMSSEIKTAGNKLFFNQNFVVVDLNAGKSLSVKNIKVASSTGSAHGAHTLAAGTRSVTIDQKPINLYEVFKDNKRVTEIDYEKFGYPSGISNSRGWKIGFDNKGVVPYKQLIKDACDNIIARLESIEMNPVVSQNIDGAPEYGLVVGDETDTIGMIFMRAALDLKLVEAITANANSGSLVIKIQTYEDIESTLRAIVDYNVAIYKKIKTEIDAAPVKELDWYKQHPE